MGYHRDITQKQVDIREALLSDNINSRVIKVIAEVGHSVDSLRQLAYANKREEIMQLD